MARHDGRITIPSENVTGLGDAASRDVGTGSGDVAAGGHASQHGSVGADSVSPVSIGAASSSALASHTGKVGTQAHGLGDASEGTIGTDVCGLTDGVVALTDLIKTQPFAVHGGNLMVRKDISDGAGGDLEELVSGYSLGGYPKGKDWIEATTGNGAATISATEIVFSNASGSSTAKYTGPLWSYGREQVAFLELPNTDDISVQMRVSSGGGVFAGVWFEQTAASGNRVATTDSASGEANHSADLGQRTLWVKVRLVDDDYIVYYSKDAEETALKDIAWTELATVSGVIDRDRDGWVAILRASNFGSNPAFDNVKIKKQYEIMQ